jgi:hypothetical protein
VLLRSGVCPPELPYPESCVSACLRFEPRAGTASPLRDFDVGIVCDRDVVGISLDDTRGAVAPVLDRCLDREGSLSACAFIAAAMPAGAELREGRGEGRVFGTSPDVLRPFDERGLLSLSLPLFLPACRSSGDSQYIREELVRPDTPPFCKRSIYSLALPWWACHLSSSGSSLSSLLDVDLLVGSGFGLVRGAAVSEGLDVRGGNLLAK